MLKQTSKFLVRILCVAIFLVAAYSPVFAQVRIVSLAPNITEIIYYLGVENSLVGVSNVETYPTAARSIEIVGAYDKPSIEKILSLKPTHILVANYQTNPVLNHLKQLPVKLINYNFDSIKDITKCMKDISRITRTGHDKYKLFNNHIRSLESVDESVSGMLVYWFDPIMTVGSHSYLHDIMVFSGIDNIYGNKEKGYIKVEIEDVIRLDPKVIVVASHLPLPDDSPLYKYCIMKGVPIIVIEDYDAILRPGPRVVGAIKSLREAVIGLDE